CTTSGWNCTASFGVWIDAEAFDPERRTGALAPAAVEEARRKRKELDWGDPSASPLAWEVDADPEYRDWLADTAAPARAALEVRRSTPKRPAGGSVIAFLGTGVRLLAAALLAVCVGLSVWVTKLKQTVGQLSEPSIDVPVGELKLGGEPRSLPNETVVPVPPEARWFVVYLVFDPQIEAEVGLLEVATWDGEVIYRSELQPIEPAGDSMLRLPRRLFPEGRYRVRLLPGASPEDRPLEEVILTVETSRVPE
ncbi:MAG TPA: hypothetical protein VE685_01760, partial [Thermoanaerobaculia bacterium]|nr:hypothetical protein [Thermoanaerobaculia bacterium]